MRIRRLPRIFAAILTSIYLSTNCLFAHQVETTVWIERQAKLSRAPRNPKTDLNNLKAGFEPTVGEFGISSLTPFGWVRQIRKPAHNKGDRVVIHIQDVHRNTEAQLNIGKAIAELMRRNHVDAVALEGAFSPIQLSALKQFPDQALVGKTADDYLRSHRISGPIQAVIKSPTPLPLVTGIDDASSYKANVDAYRRSIPQQKARLAALSESVLLLSGKKKKVFNPDLAAFDDLVQRHRAGEISLGKFALSLEPSAGSTEFLSFVEAVKTEAKLDFTRVEFERSAVLTRLLPALNKPETENLIAVTAAYRQSRVKHGEFYSYLKNLCLKNRIDLRQFPAFHDYLRHVLLSDSIDGEALMEDIRKIEEERYEALARTPTEKELVAESKRLYLEKKLLEFALTKDEWDTYKKGMGNAELSSFEDFYRQAEIRDQKMAENFLKTVGGTKHVVGSEKNPDSTRSARRATRLSVLVTGGFHSAGINRRLTEAGFTVIQFAPKLSKAEAGGGTAYLSVFAQEHTPLEKLFAGEKLFLARAPISQADWYSLLHEIGARLIRSEKLTGDPLRRILSAAIPGLSVTQIKEGGKKVEFHESWKNQNGDIQEFRAIVSDAASDAVSVSLQPRDENIRAFLTGALWEIVFSFPVIYAYLISTMFSPAYQPFAGVLLAGGSFLLMREIFVYFHDEAAFAAVNEVRRAYGAELLTMRDYRRQLRGLFTRINLPLLVSLTLLQCGIFTVAFAIASGSILTTFLHLDNNIKFISGDFDAAPVAGATKARPIGRNPKWVINDLLEALGLDKEEIVAKFETTPRETKGDVTIRTIELPVKKQEGNIEILRERLGASRFQLLYRKNRLIAVFPVVSPTIKSTLEFFDLSPFYTEVPQLNSHHPVQAWRNLSREIKSDLREIEKFQSQRPESSYKAVSEGSYGFNILWVDFKDNSIDKEPLNYLNPGDQIRRNLINNPKRRYLIYPAFPTVYNQAFTADEKYYKDVLNSGRQTAFGENWEPIIPGPGAGTDTWFVYLAWLISMGEDPTISRQKPKNPFHLRGLNPLEVANSRVTARLMGIDIVAETGDNVPESGEFDAVYWNMPSAIEFNKSKATSLRFEQAHDGDDGLTTATTLANRLPKILRKNGFGMFWNVHNPDQKFFWLLKTAGQSQKAGDDKEVMDVKFTLGTQFTRDVPATYIVTHPPTPAEPLLHDPSLKALSLDSLPQANHPAGAQGKRRLPLGMPLHRVTGNDARDWLRSIIPDHWAYLLMIPGMSYDDLGMWWSSHGTRSPLPHTGFDSAAGAAEGGRLEPLPEGRPVHAPFKGTVLEIVEDEMQTTVIVETDLMDTDGRPLVIFYEHIKPARPFKAGDPIAQGELLGTIVRSRTATASVVWHLHTSTAFMTFEAMAKLADVIQAWKELKKDPSKDPVWKVIDPLVGPDKFFTFFDPLELFHPEDRRRLFRRVPRDDVIRSLIIHPTKKPAIYQLKQPLGYEHPGVRIDEIRHDDPFTEKSLSWDEQLVQFLATSGFIHDLVITPDPAIYAQLLSFNAHHHLGWTVLLWEKPEVDKKLGPNILHLIKPLRRFLSERNKSSYLHGQSSADLYQDFIRSIDTDPVLLRIAQNYEPLIPGFIEQITVNNQYRAPPQVEQPTIGLEETYIPPGSIFGNFIFDSYWEVVFVLPVIEVPLGLIFLTPTSAIQWLSANVGFAGPPLVAFALTIAVFILMKEAYKRAHRQRALDAVNNHRKKFIPEDEFVPLTLKEYRDHLDNLFVHMNLPLLLLTSFTLSYGFADGFYPVAAILLVIGLLLNIKRHLANNLAFRAGRLNEAPVAGSLFYDEKHLPIEKLAKEKLPWVSKNGTAYTVELEASLIKGASIRASKYRIKHEESRNSENPAIVLELGVNEKRHLGILHFIASNLPKGSGVPEELIRFIQDSFARQGLDFFIDDVLNPRILSIVRKLPGHLEVEFMSGKHTDVEFSKPWRILGDQESRELDVYDAYGFYSERIVLSKDGDGYRLSKDRFLIGNRHEFQMHIAGQGREATIAIERKNLNWDDSLPEESFRYFIPVNERNDGFPFLQDFALVHPLYGRQAYVIVGEVAINLLRLGEDFAVVKKDGSFWLEGKSDKLSKELHLSVKTKKGRVPHKVTINDRGFVHHESMNGEELLPLIIRDSEGRIPRPSYRIRSRSLKFDTSFVWVKLIELFGVGDPEEKATKYLGWWAEAIVFVAVCSIGAAFGQPFWGVVAAFIGLLALHIKRVTVDQDGNFDTQWLGMRLDSRGPPWVAALRGLLDLSSHAAGFVLYFTPLSVAFYFVPINELFLSQEFISAFLWAIGSHFLSVIFTIESARYAPNFIFPEWKSGNDRLWINSNPANEPLISPEKIEAADRVLKPSLNDSPLVLLPDASDVLGKDVFLFDESEQQGGSFKARGVYYEIWQAINRVIEKDRTLLKRGVKIVTQSTGNHGIALMRSVTRIILKLSEIHKDDPDLVADLQKIEPIVFTLANLPADKKRRMKAALREYQSVMRTRKGRLLNSYGNYEEALEARQRFVHQEAGAALYMDHSGPDIVEGHATAGKRIAEKLAAAGIGEDKKVLLLLPIGAGGPIGIAAALKHYRKNVVVFGVQSDRWDALVKSVQNGSLQKNPGMPPPTFIFQDKGKTIAMTFPDGIAVDAPEGNAVELAENYLDGMLSVDEREALQMGAVLLWGDLAKVRGTKKGVRVGGTTALSLQAVLSHIGQIKAFKEAHAVVVFGTEGNVEPVVTRYLKAEQHRRKKIKTYYSKLKHYREIDLLRAGGTIEMTQAGIRSIADEVEKLESLSPRTVVSRKAYPDLIDSSDMGPLEWKIIIERVRDLIGRKMALRKTLKELGRDPGEAGGIILTMGTDTVEHAGLVFSLALGRELEEAGIPLILTASAHPLNVADSDAPKNFLNACLLAHNHGTRAGVYFCFGGKTFIAGSLRKMIGTNPIPSKEALARHAELDLFDGHEMNDKISLPYLTLRDPSDVFPAVEIVVGGPTTPDDAFDRVFYRLTARLRAGASAGLIVKGTASPRVIQKFAEANIPIFTESQLPAGLTVEKARTKLFCLLWARTAPEKLPEQMNQNLAGELFGSTFPVKVPENNPEAGTAVVYLYPGMREDVIADAITALGNSPANDRRLYVYGFGDGHAPQRVIPAIETAARSGIDVIVRSQCPLTQANLNDYELGGRLKKAGARTDILQITKSLNIYYPTSHPNHRRHFFSRLMKLYSSNKNPEIARIVIGKYGRRLQNFWDWTKIDYIALSPSSMEGANHLAAFAEAIGKTIISGSFLTIPDAFSKVRDPSEPDVKTIVGVNGRKSLTVGRVKMDGEKFAPVFLGRRVVLLDDIFGTGVTLNEAFEVLRQMRPESIVPLVMGISESRDAASTSANVPLLTHLFRPESAATDHQEDDLIFKTRRYFLERDWDTLLDEEEMELIRLLEGENPSTQDRSRLYSLLQEKRMSLLKEGDVFKLADRYFRLGRSEKLQDGPTIWIARELIEGKEGEPVLIAPVNTTFGTYTGFVRRNDGSVEYNHSSPFLDPVLLHPKETDGLILYEPSTAKHFSGSVAVANRMRSHLFFFFLYFGPLFMACLFIPMAHPYFTGIISLTIFWAVSWHLGISLARLADPRHSLPKKKDLLAILKNENVPLVYARPSDPAWRLLIDTSLKKHFTDTQLSNDPNLLATAGVCAYESDIIRVAREFGISKEEFLKRIGVSPLAKTVVVLQPMKDELTERIVLLEEVFHVLEGEPGESSKYGVNHQEIINDLIQLFFYPRRAVASFHSSYTQWLNSTREALYDHYISRTGLNPNFNIGILLEMIKEDLRKAAVDNEGARIFDLIYNNPLLMNPTYLRVRRQRIYSEAISYLEKLVAREKFKTYKQLFPNWKPSTLPKRIFNTSFAWPLLLDAGGASDAERRAVTRISWWAETLIAALICLTGTAFGSPGGGIAVALAVLALLHAGYVVSDETGRLRVEWIWELKEPRIGVPSGGLARSLAAFNALLGSPAELNTGDTFIPKYKSSRLSTEEFNGIVASVKHELIHSTDIENKPLHMPLRHSDKKALKDLSNYLEKNSFVKIRILVDAREKNQFTSWSEKFGRGRVHIDAVNGLFGKSGISAGALEKALARLKRDGELNNAVFVFSEEILQDLIETGDTRRGLLFDLRYILFNDLLSILTRVPIRNMGATIDAAARRAVRSAA